VSKLLISPVMYILISRAFYSLGEAVYDEGREEGNNELRLEIFESKGPRSMEVSLRFLFSNDK